MGDRGGWRAPLLVGLDVLKSPRRQRAQSEPVNLGSTLVALLVAVVVKGAVMVFAGRLLPRLYGARHGQTRLYQLVPREDAPGARELWWALVLFSLSELVCGVEVYIPSQASPILSSIHGVSSAAGMGLFAAGLYDVLDRKMLRFGTRGCAGNRICRGCTVVAGQRCRFSPVLLALATLVVLAAVLPWFASTDPVGADARKLILPFPALNAWYDGSVVPWIARRLPWIDLTGQAYIVPRSVFILEYRLLPAIAGAFAAAAIVVLRSGHERAGARLLLVGAGGLSYSYFELLLYQTTGDGLLAGLGHEIGEFWFLIATGELLAALFSARHADPRAAR